jgi:serine/threonine-protein kinase
MMTQENILARYKVLHELGRGATGTVYAANDRTTGAVVALKRLDPASLDNEANSAARLLKHARSARHLRHRNIARTFDAGEAGGTVYVAMEMLEGESLRNILEAGPLPIARAIQIAHDIAGGLAYAHLEGVVHAGLKPSNIIVVRSGGVKITDFGIGQAGLSYMAPEQLRGDPVDHRSDIFALGALFYEMLTHRPPFEGNSAKEILEAAHAKPPLPSELNPHAPRALDKIVLSMLAGQPGVRMPGVPILLRDLQSLKEGLGLGAETNARIDEPAASVPAPAPEPELRTPDPTHAEVFDHQKAMAVMERESRQVRSSRPRPAMFAALAVTLTVLGIGLAGFMGLTGLMEYVSFLDPSSGLSERGIAASPVQQAPEASPPTAPAPVAVAEATEEPETVPDAPQPESLAVERAYAQPEPVSAAPVQPLPETIQPTAKVAEQQPRGTAQAARTAQLILAVSPRGEIYIDGKHHGTTPPITTFDLQPGMHRVEVRNGSRKPFLTYMTVQAGDVRRIRHDFNAKPIRPPT